MPTTAAAGGRESDTPNLGGKSERCLVRVHGNEFRKSPISTVTLSWYGKFRSDRSARNLSWTARSRQIDALLDQDARSNAESDYLDVLSDLVEKYEDEHDPMPPVSDAEMLRFLIENQRTTQARLATETGISESTISEILAGKRALNRKHIEVLSRHFHVSPAVFISV